MVIAWTEYSFWNKARDLLKLSIEAAGCDTQKSISLDNLIVVDSDVYQSDQVCPTLFPVSGTIMPDNPPLNKLINEVKSDLSYRLKFSPEDSLFWVKTDP